MADRIQFRRGTEARWAEVNPVLMEGEIGYVSDKPNQYKMGDGISTWNSLPYRGFDGTLAHEAGTSESVVMTQKATTDYVDRLGVFETGNEEFVYALIDEEDKVLYGIRYDGTVFQCATDDITVSLISDLRVIIESEIISRLSLKVDKEEGKGLINTVIADTFSVISNEEFILAVVDSEDTVLIGLRRDGTQYTSDIDDKTKEEISTLQEYIDSLNTLLETKVNKEDNKGLIDSTVGESITSSSTEEFMEVTTDEEGKIIAYRSVDGAKHETKLVIEKEIDAPQSEAIKLFEKATSDEETRLSFEAQLKADGFAADNVMDWSNEEVISIPKIKNCALVNFIAPKLGTTKRDNIEGMIEFWDRNGNYFKIPMILNAQGSSSMSWWKKNQGIDLLTNEHMYDDDYTTDLKIGNWVPQDSFHIKKYYIDVFRGQSIAAYRFMEEVVQSRGVCKTKPWEYQQQFDSITNSSGKFLQDFDSGALAHPDGFPIMLYLNGELQGLYAWALKKHRSNYNMNKNATPQIILDGALGAGKMFGQTAAEIIWYDAVDWSHYGFEIRNPKSLVYKEYNSDTDKVGTILAYKYDGDSNKEIAGIDNNYKGDWQIGYNGGYSQNDVVKVTISDVDYYFISTISGNTATPSLTKNSNTSPDYKNNNGTNWINCTQSVIVKQNIQRLAESTIALAATPTKEVFEQYYLVEPTIDYYIVSQVLYHWDGFDKNWIWCTWDSQKWCPTLYDADSIFGTTWNGVGMTTNDFNQMLGHNDKIPTYYLRNLYLSEIKGRYAELRDKGIISADNITSLLLEWVKECGYDNLKTDIEECCADNGIPQTPSYRDGSLTYTQAPTTGGFYNSPQRIRNWLKEHINYLDTYFEYNA